MNWYYESGGQQQGPVSDTDLDRLLAEGKITLDTLVWREGMPGWTPFRTARGSAPAGGGLSLEKDPGLEVTRPAQSSAGAPSPTAGSDVPQPGWIRCTLTGRYFPPSEIIYIEGQPYSAAAKPQVIANLQSGNMTVGAGGGPAWEHRDSLGIWKALVDTVKAVLTLPVETFSTMRRTGGLGGPIFFWLITAGGGAVIQQIYNVVVQSAVGVAAASGGSSSQAATVLGTNAIGGVVGIFIVPIFMIIGLFIQVGLTHLTLMMLKGANQPFETTFRTFAYAMGATGTLNVIPVCGSFVAAIWGIVAVCLGLGKAHGTTTEKGVAAVLIPFGICCLLVLGLYMVAGVAIFSAMSSGGSGF